MRLIHVVSHNRGRVAVSWTLLYAVGYSAGHLRGSSSPCGSPRSRWRHVIQPLKTFTDRSRLMKCLRLVLPLLFASPCAALGPNDVWIITNRNVPESKEIADHYCRVRGVPGNHVLAFDLPKGEDTNRRDYDAKLVAPLREALREKRDQVKVLLTVYGV